MNLKRIGNKIYDGLYYFWYGYRRAKATDPVFKEFSTKARIPVGLTYPEYLKSMQPKPLLVNSQVSTGTELCKKLQEGLQLWGLISNTTFTVELKEETLRAIMEKPPTELTLMGLPIELDDSLPVGLIQLRWQGAVLYEIQNIAVPIDF